MNKLFEHICAFEKRLELFQVQLGIATLTHFTCHAASKIEFPDPDSTNFVASLQKLSDEFTIRFPEFRQNEIKASCLLILLLGFGSPDDFQMELIEL